MNCKIPKFWLMLTPWVFLNWAQSHTSRRLRDPTGAAPAAKRTDHFQGFPLLQLDSQGMGQKASSRDTKGKIGALDELSW